MQNNYNWADLAFSSKKPLSNLNATFIAAPREMSAKRFIQLVKTYLPKGNIVLGLAIEQYIDGFEGQVQFKTLQKSTVEQIISKTNASESANKIYTLSYFQRELNYVLEKVKFGRVVLINGSWHKTFHSLPVFYTLINTQAPYEYVSPFADEQEAVDYAKKHGNLAVEVNGAALHSADEMLQIAANVAKTSFATDFQTGAALGLAKSKDNYEYLAQACNTVVPYLTYAMHNGSAREKHFSPPNDLNYYDTVHAEVALVLVALEQQISLDNTALFINLLPCPSCARMLAATPIKEVYYQIDHSDGYAVKLLESAGKKVIRIVQ